MNTGIISSRYAKALLKLVIETGNGDAVYGQVRQMLADPDEMPSPLAPELEQFVSLLMKNHRIEYVRLMLNTFVKMYDEHKGREYVQIVTAVPAPQLEQDIKAVLEHKCEVEVIVESRIDPDIIGGFVLYADDRMLDASVSSQIEGIRRQFIEKNKRIV